MNAKWFRTCKILMVGVIFFVPTLISTAFSFSGWTQDGDHVV